VNLHENTKKALIIEDEATVQSILSAFLQRFLGETDQSGDIRTFTDPVQGLFELTTNGVQYDIILMDVRMPKLAGDEIYNSLAHVNPDLLERVLFVTGYPEDLRMRWPDKALNVLEKPFRYQVFRECVAPILD